MKLFIEAALTGFIYQYTDSCHAV